MRLKDKVAIITGAASGMGRASAVLFAKEGARIIVADIDNEGATETVRQIKAAGGEARFVFTDVSKSVDVEKVVKESMDRYGRLDIMFNNAGHPGKTMPVENVEESLWDLVYAVNVKSIFYATKAVVPLMKKQGGGTILNTVSIIAERPRPNQVLYGSSKGAAMSLTKLLAVELAPFNIRVNCLNPVGSDTPMLAKFKPDNLDAETFRKNIAATVPMGRPGKPEDVANAALYLASDEACFITGVCFPVDGGRSI
jgi:3-oxoacyl-[acyl-carrier protein] reductase